MREFEVDDGFVFGDLDALDFFEFLDAGLNLFGFGGLGAEAIDEGFELLDFVVLVFVRGLELGEALGLLAAVFFVAAGIEGDALVPDLGDFLDGDVEEVAVVRDEDVGEFVVG